MAVPVDPPCDFGPLFRVERARLLELLAPLSGPEWARPTPCPAWDVLGLAAHILGGDFSVLAGQRDGHRGTPAPAGQSEDEFIGWLDELQAEWVHTARRLSPRLVVELLGWTDRPLADLVAAQDSTAVDAHVTWAGTAPVPKWLDHARELSERWIHRQQLREALGRGSDLRADLAEPVLDGFRWAYPFRLARHRRPPGDTVEILVADGGDPGDRIGARRWVLVSDGDGDGDGGWRFAPTAGGPVVARLGMTTEQAWRLLTNNLDVEVHGAPEATGDPAITRTLVRTRAIIGTPQ